MNIWLLVLLLAVAVVAALLALAVKRVPEGQSFTVHRRGRFHRILSPGIHVVVPLLDRVAHRVNTLGRVMEVACEDLHTKDDHTLVAQGQVYFQVLDARKAADRDGAINQAARDLARVKAQELVEQMTYEVFSHRTSRELNSWLLGLLNQSSSEWGVRVTRIQMDFNESEPRKPA
ncbi:MAG: SPFH domain-containing protein [Xanthomonadales bacterium]|nr:SPFH domain-containing protein [Xanthomonadales bacterium]